MHLEDKEAIVAGSQQGLPNFCPVRFAMAVPVAYKP